MKNIILISLILFSGLFQQVTHAAIPNSNTENWLNGPGIIRGGNAEAFMSVLDVRRSHSASLKTERLIIDWGNKIMQPAEKSGYYQVEYKKNPDRVIINLTQTLNTKFEPTHVMDKIGKAVYIKKAQIEFDPISQSQNIILLLNKSLKVKVASYPAKDKNSSAKLVVDFVE
jgi:hypothetical protein